jgi:hypothetical protein
MNENPKMIVASGTSDGRVFFGLKINRQMKIMAMTATDKRTPSSFATIESTSWITPVNNFS